MNKKFRIVLCVVTILTLIGGSLSAYGASLSEINNSIGNKQQELKQGKNTESQLGSEVGALEAKIADAEKEINTLVGTMAGVQVEVDALTAELDVQKKEIDKSVDGLNARLRNMYKSGTIGFIDVILSSENVSDLLSNIDMVKEIYSGDKNLVETLEKEYAKIEEKQVALTAKQNELAEQKAAIADKQAALSADKNAVAEKKTAVANNNAKLEAEIDQLVADANALTSEINDATSGSDVPNSGSGFAWPTPGYTNVTSPFGYRIHPIFGTSKLHTGIDIGAPHGAKIVASKSGRVIMANNTDGYGNKVLIDHGGGEVTLYAHCSGFAVSAGQTVSQGQTIAYVGSTGNSTGAHLHFEVRINGNYTNPMGYL
ncbi:MAG: peptidoglycan DD-metalloendopeptidase family protein [Anaerovoracaceae bacterium]